MQIALLTDPRYTAVMAGDDDWYLQNILHEDQLLSVALKPFGIQTKRIAWCDSHVDWTRFAAVVFRTTWDYFDRFHQFSRWLNQLDQSQVRMLNSARLIRWNQDKHYLLDLEERGVGIVPSRFLEFDATLAIPESLVQAFVDCGWDQAVIKPCVSGAARHTYRMDRSNVEQIAERLESVMRNEAFILQEFQTGILTHGERTLVLFGDQVTHAVQKTGKPGDFRVQDDYGGIATSCQATEEEVEFARRAIHVCPEQPVYGRVDLIRDNRGELCVMELELIEPELWMRLAPWSAERFARGIAQALEVIQA